MLKVLWLTSWYPNPLDKMNGDFVQRHARAVSLYCNLQVIHLEADKKNELKNKSEVFTNISGNLHETLVLYRLSQLPIIGKYFSFFRYRSLFKEQIQQYIAINGKPDIVHVHVPIKAGVIALLLKKKYDIPYAVTEHWTIYNKNSPEFFGNKNYFFRFFTKKILKKAAAFLPVSEDLGKKINEVVTPLPFSVVPNTVDTTLFNYSVSADKDAGVFNFAHVSTLNYQKNAEGILRAFKVFNSQNKNSKLFMVGEAGEAIKKYSNSLEIPTVSIEFTGLVSYTEVSSILKQSHAFILFSRYENLPCVILESLCCGLPVISTNTGGINEVINSSNGILINIEDEHALNEAMNKMFFNYKEYDRKKISGDAVKKFSYEVVGKKIVEVYEKIISAKT